MNIECITYGRTIGLDSAKDLVPLKVEDSRSTLLDHGKLKNHESKILWLNWIDFWEKKPKAKNYP